MFCLFIFSDEYLSYSYRSYPALRAYFMDTALARMSGSEGLPGPGLGAAHPGPAGAGTAEAADTDVYMAATPAAWGPAPSEGYWVRTAHGKSAGAAWIFDFTRRDFDE